MKSATLNTILEANGKPTGDQLVAERDKAAAARIAHIRSTLPVPMTARELKRLVRTYNKAGTQPPWEASQ